jgi:hypothetical protein
VQYYDPATGAAVSADPNLVAAAASTSSPDALYAGLAYEVHFLMPDGTTTPVNPATHEFHTGERFIVFYRPTLPGHMDVYNINPAGVQTQIDALDIAAGQLSRLGPYEFAALSGEEQLRLILTPCSSSTVPFVTRDIVNVSQTVTPGAMAPGAPLGLQACAGAATRSIRSVRTRDIRKVAVDGTTAFALDPVSLQEQTSGGVAPREITIVLHHR